MHVSQICAFAKTAGLPAPQRNELCAKSWMARSGSAPGRLRTTWPPAAGAPVADLPPLATMADAWLAEAPLAITAQVSACTGGRKRLQVVACSGGEQQAVWRL